MEEFIGYYHLILNDFAPFRSQIDTEEEEVFEEEEENLEEDEEFEPFEAEELEEQ